MKLYHMSLEEKRQNHGILFILPWIIGFIIFFTIPLGQAILYTFSKIDVKAGAIVRTPVGLANYKLLLFEDPDTIRVVLNRIGGLFSEVLILIIFSLFIAIVLNQKFKGRTFARTIFVLPIIISSGLIIAILKEDVFASKAGIQATTMLQATALKSFIVNAGINAKYATYASMIVSSVYDIIWRSGVQILLFLAALQSVSPTLYEAAQVEGATPWQSFWEITLPLVSPFILVNIVYSIVDYFTNYENKVMKMVYTYLRNLDYAMGTTMAVIYFVVVFAILMVVLGILSRVVFYVEE